jgi:hypothetical protein
VPILIVMYGVARNRELMGDHRAGRIGAAGYLVAIAGIAACVVALGVVSVT